MDDKDKMVRITVLRGGDVAEHVSIILGDIERSADVLQPDDDQEDHRADPSYVDEKIQRWDLDRLPHSLLGALEYFRKRGSSEDPILVEIHDRYEIGDYSWHLYRGATSMSFFSLKTVPSLGAAPASETAPPPEAPE